MNRHIRERSSTKIAQRTDTDTGTVKKLRPATMARPELEMKKSVDLVCQSSQ